MIVMISREEPNKNGCVNSDVITEENVGDSIVSNGVSDDNIANKLSDVDKLRDEQLVDQSLTNCFSLARRGKANLIVINNLLHR